MSSPVSRRPGLLRRLGSLVGLLAVVAGLPAVWMWCSKVMFGRWQPLPALPQHLGDVTRWARDASNSPTLLVPAAARLLLVAAVAVWVVLVASIVAAIVSEVSTTGTRWRVPRIASVESIARWVAAGFAVAATSLPLRPANATPPLARPTLVAARTGPAATAHTANVTASVSRPADRGVHDVQIHESAAVIARRYTGDESRWKELWTVNQGRVVDPDTGEHWREPWLIRPGWQLTLPTAWLAAPAVSDATPADTGGRWTVKPGDSLWRIAETVLGDGSRWVEIQAANAGHQVAPGVVFDGTATLIHPGWMLTVPPASNVPADPGPVSASTLPPPTAPRVEAADPGVVVPNPPAAPAAVIAPEITAAANVQPVDPSAPSAPANPSSVERVPSSVAPVTEPSTAGPNTGEDGSDRSTLAGVSGAVVLASALVVVLGRQRRRRRVRGTRSSNRPSARITEVEAAVVAASDVPFVRWAGQELALLARRLSPAKLPGAPVAVELDPDGGMEVLWDRASHGAPAPWESTDGGWSWRVLYDPDEPAPPEQWASPVPGLITVGTREGRQLLIDLEHVGTLAVLGPNAAVDAWVRSAVLELGAGDDLADAWVVTVDVGVDGVEHLDRVSAATTGDAIAFLTGGVRDADSVLAGDEPLFHHRLGPQPLMGVRASVVVCGRGVEPDDQARIAAVVQRRRGVAAIVTADRDTVGARLVLDGHGHGVLAGIAEQPIHVTAAGVPREVAAEVAVMLDHEHTPPDTDGESHEGSSELIAELDDFIATDDTEADTDQLPVAARAHGAMFGDDTDDVDLDTATGLLGRDPNEQAWERPRPAVLVRVLGCPAVPALPQLKELDKRLLAYLACQEGAPVSRGRVRDAVWGGSARETKTLSNHLSALRNALGNNQHGEPFLPTNGAGPLRLDPAVMTDLTVFKSLVSRARNVASSEAALLLRDALDLVEGEPFNAVGYEWAAVTQDGYQTHHEIVEAAIELYRLASDANDLATARFAVVQGSKAVPMHEELYRLRMQLEHRAANIAAVHAAFSELSEQLMMLDCSPSTETVSLYRQLVGKTSSWTPPRSAR